MRLGFYIPEAMVDEMSARILQFPAMTLESIWRRGVSRVLPGTAAEKNALRDRMYTELQELEIVE